MRKGFTLIELVIVITIIGIISGVVGYILLGTVQGWTFKASRNDLLWDGRLAMNRMVREIREIKDSTSVTTADSSQFKFIDMHDTDITYSINSTILNRTEGGTSNKIAENVSAIVFTYYSSSGSTITTPLVAPLSTDIRRIKIDLTLTKGGENVYLQSEGVPRNF